MHALTWGGARDERRCPGGQPSDCVGRFCARRRQRRQAARRHDARSDLPEIIFELLSAAILSRGLKPVCGYWRFDSVHLRRRRFRKCLSAEGVGRLAIDIEPVNV